MKMSRESIGVYDPFSEFLQGETEEFRFDVTLLDVVRFSGHACPSVVGAFLLAKRATEILFPETNVVVRGDVRVETAASVLSGATGPMTNVFSYILGAWAESGFPGLRGQFVRRGLMRFDRPEVPDGCFRFQRISTGVSVDLRYESARVPFSDIPGEPFQRTWRRKIEEIISNPEMVVLIHY